jgi:uncharacterized membrane protein
MEPYVGALIVLSFVIILVITSINMIEKTMRSDNLDFSIEAEGGIDFDESETQSALQADIQSALETEATKEEPDAEEDEEEAEEAEEAEAEEAEAEAEEAEAEDESEPHSPIVLTYNEKQVINRFFSQTIGELLKIRLENERRKKV